MLITDQVATAPCTDPVQEWFRTFEAKLASTSTRLVVKHHYTFQGHQTVRDHLIE